MNTFLLAVDEAWFRIGRIVAFVLSVGAPGSEHFSLFLFIYLAFVLFVSSLSACRARSRSGNMTTFLLAVDEAWPRGTSLGGALSRIGI